VRQTEAAALRGAQDASRIGTAVAVLAGDLASVLADQLFLEAGFPAKRLVGAMEHYNRMRLEMAAGQYLDLIDADADARRLAYLKGGSYTVEGPLLFGAALAGATLQVEAHLRRYGEPLGEAFQMLDDLRDGESPPGVTAEDAMVLVQQAKEALDPAVLDPDAAKGLRVMADLVGSA
jgi:geranylgeranyl diphosphate synthase type I